MTKVVVYVGSEKFRLHERADVELRFSLSLGWHLFRQIESENRGFFKQEKSQVCVLKELGLPYCILIDGAVVAGKRYNRKSVHSESVQKIERKKIHGAVIEGCIRVRK